MNKQLWACSAFVLVTQLGCTSVESLEDGQVVEQAEVVLEPCSSAWNNYVEDALISGDGQGHGPDIGSEEWKSVIEFKLNVRGNKEVPSRNSKAWCRYIDEKLQSISEQKT